MKDEDGDAVMDRASPPCKVSSSTIRKRKNEEINTVSRAMDSHSEAEADEADWTMSMIFRRTRRDAKVFERYHDSHVFIACFALWNTRHRVYHKDGGG